jgi:hypothetical protein
MKTGGRFGTAMAVLLGLAFRDGSQRSSTTFGIWMTACSTTWRAPTAAAVCDVLAFATGFDALTGAMTRIDPKGTDGQRLSNL